MMGTCLVVYLSFLIAYIKVNPTKIVDHAIDILVDFKVPFSKNFQDNWFERKVRSFLYLPARWHAGWNFRQDLYNWEFSAHVRHELVVRCIAGVVASLVTTILYIWLKRMYQPRNSRGFGFAR